MKPALDALVLVLMLAWPAAVGAQAPDAVAETIVNSPGFKAARAFVDKDHDRIVNDIIRLTEIPAPPFEERERGRVYLQLLRQHGLQDVEMDEAGNVMGVRRGAGGGPLVAIAGHLDTVFPEGTDVKVRRQGTKLMAPGIGDTTRSLAVLLGMIRALDAARIQTTSDVLFIGNVGEEGPGDLRGVRYLFDKGKYKDRIRRFVSMDGTGDSKITTGALGSRRYRVTFRGPGGHSYGAFGLVSPAFAMGNAILKLSKVQVPRSPKTTFNVGVVGGGTSVNSIPFESWMQVDMRSESRSELDGITETFLRVIDEAVDEENRTRSTAQGQITAKVSLIGDRPSGETPKDSAIVQMASAAIRAHGLTPVYDISSTDSNIPISKGIPAVTIGSGGTGGRAHALDEWIDVEKAPSVRGISVAMTILLALAGMQP